MTPETVDQLKRLMEYEAARNAPPLQFPKLPDIPAGRYTDPRYYALEKAHIWRKAWLFAAHIDEIPEPGCFIKWENTGEPVVIVHAEDGSINAFFNTCRHRGAPVVTDSSGRRPTLTCKYHGWSYGLNGDLLSVRDQVDFEDLDFSCRGLLTVRCERFGNLIFLNFDADAPPLIEWLGPVADEWREFQFENCRLVNKRSFDLKCNWKIAMEANTEVYHVRNIHPTTVAPMLDDRRNVNTFYANGHGRMVAPRREQSAGASGGGGAIDRSPFPQIDTVGEIGRTCTQSYGVFPNWVSPLSDRTIPPLLFWPTSIRTCRFEVWTMYHGAGSPAPSGALPNIWTSADGTELGQVLLEDTQFGEAIQKSMESSGFQGVPLSYQEARIYHWNQWADRLIGIDNIPPELRVEQVMGDEWLMPNEPRLAELDAVSGG
ncbi:MAG: SRPBCC family protein [Pseudomonadota bacterium]